MIQANFRRISRGHQSQPCFYLLANLHEQADFFQGGFFILFFLNMLTNP